ncbi:MAG TPA: PQQ-binding-like beta-propeller repeat protein [bacterium]
MKFIKIAFLITLTLTGCSKIKIIHFISERPIVKNWEMYGGNTARTNFYPGDISLPLKLKWRYDATSAIGKTMLAVDGILYFTTLDGRLYALNIETGKKIGHKKTIVDATQAYQDTNLVLALRYGDETLFKYNLKSAKYDWKIDAGDIASEPLVLDQNIIVTALYNHIDFYDLKNGVRIWQTKTPDQIRSSPAMKHDKIVFGCDDGFVYAVERLTGAITWKFKTGASVQATPVIGDTIVYVGSLDKNFYAISLNSGKPVWSFQAGGQLFEAAALDNEFIIFGSADSKIYCLDRFSGKEIWAFEAKSVISTSPLICQDKVFFGSLDNFYYALDLKTGKELWKYETKGRVRTNPVIWGEYLIGASENNYVYIFSPEQED